jgi:hypothetical protein
MSNQVYHNIEVKGNYVYINNHCIAFDSEKQAQDFLFKLIEEGFLD